MASAGGFLFGYDLALIAGALPFLTRDFALSSATAGWAASSAILGRYHRAAARALVRRRDWAPAHHDGLGDAVPGFHGRMRGRALGVAVRDLAAWLAEWVSVWR